MDLRGPADDSQLVEAETTQKLIQWVSSYQNAIGGDDCDSDEGTEGMNSVSNTTGLDSTIVVNAFFVGKVHEGALVARDGLEDPEPLWAEPLAMVPLGPVVTDGEVFVGEEELEDRKSVV